ncbi:ADP-glyceromanno-heptose 6-epimerase [bacterium]|nr:ADP-glyceromanno-heptose 6-epimerase [bacterium]
MLVITGSAGFIGSALVWGFNRRGFDDILIVDTLGSNEKWKNLRNLRFSDFMDKTEFIERLEKNELDEIVDDIIHMGACSDTMERDADFLIHNNYEYTKRIALWCLRKGKRLIYASSAATYGDGSRGFSDDHSLLPSLKPLNMYAYSKHLFDLWAYRNGYLDKMVGLKYFNVFGPNEYHKGEMRSLVHKAFEQVKMEGKIKLFKSYKPQFAHGQQMRDFLYIKDAVDMTIFLYERKEASGIFNVGRGEARSFYDLAVAVFKALGKPENIEFIDMPLEIRDKYQYRTQADIRKLRQLGYDKEITPLEEAVREYIQYYLLQPDPYLGNEKERS